MRSRLSLVVVGLCGCATPGARISPPVPVPAEPSPPEVVKVQAAELPPLDDPELQQADELYALRIRQAPQDPRGYLARGHVRRKGGDALAAVHLYEAAIRVAPNFGAGYASLGALLMENDAPKRALEVLMEGAARAPEHAPTFANLAGVLSALGRKDEAVSASETALELDPKEADLHRNHVAILYRAGQLAEAEQALKRAIVLFPDDAADFLMRLSELYGVQGRDLHAVEILERVSELVPNHPLSYLRRAAILGKRDDLDGAIRALTEGVTRIPDDEEIRTFFMAAMALRLQRDLEEGMGRLQGNPTDVTAYLQVARVHEVSKDYPAAEEILRLGVGRNPKSAVLWRQLALMQLSQKEEKAALTSYRRAIVLDRRSAVALNNCAYLLVTAHDETLRNRQEALVLVREALKLEPHNTAYLDTLAEVLFARGEVAAAREAITTALQSEPDDEHLLAQAQRFDEALQQGARMGLEHAHAP